MDISHLPWIVMVVVASFCGVLSGFLDNYTADVLFAGKHAQAEKMFFGPIYAAIGVVLLALLQPSFGNPWPMLMMIGAGAVSALGSIAYFAGIVREETTAARIFCQLTPVFNLILAWAFLGQAISGWQMVAFLVTLSAPLIVIFAKRKRGKLSSAKAAGFFVIYSLISASSSLLFVWGSAEAGENMDFLACLALMLVGKGTMNMLIMGAMPKWRKHFYRCTKKQGWWRMFGVMGANLLVWGVADTLYRLATVSADAVALVSVSYEALGLILTFFLGLLFSLLWPSFGREKMDRRTIMAHLIATVVAALGIFLIK